MAEQTYGNVTIRGFVIGPVVVNDYVLGVVQNEENEYALQIQRGGETQTIPVVSPIMTTEAIEGGTRVTIEDISGTRSFDILNGKDGIDGKDGQDGKDGISPVVAVTEIENGHRVTITDAEGEKTFDVPNGGSGMPEGGAPYQQLVTDGEGVAKWEDRLAYEGELLAVNSHLDAMMYRVADVPATLPAEGDSVTIWLKYGENTMSRDEVVSAEKEDGTFEEDGYISIMQNSAVIALRDNVAVLMTNGEYTHPFPKKGVYFFGSDTGYVSGISFTADATAPEIEWDGQTSVVKPIDPKYLPEPYYFEAFNVTKDVVEQAFKAFNVGRRVFVNFDMVLNVYGESNADGTGFYAFTTANTCFEFEVGADGNVSVVSYSNVMIPLKGGNGQGVVVGLDYIIPDGDGNSGYVKLTGAYGIAISSPNNKTFKITVDDSGTLTATEVTT